MTNPSSRAVSAPVPGWLETIRALPTTLHNLRSEIAKLRRTVDSLPDLFTNMENLIMATAEELVFRFNEATNEVASDMSVIKAALVAALADQGVVVSAAVAAELAKFDAPITRLEALGADPADPIPAPPVVE